LSASGISRVDDLQRHERSPNTTGKDIAYRSVFEKIFLECEVLVPEPEAITPEDGTVPLVGGGIVENFVCDEAEAFTEAAARLMAERPLGLGAGAGVWELGLIGALVRGGTVDEIEEQLCELGKRCSAQNF